MKISGSMQNSPEL